MESESLATAPSERLLKRVIRLDIAFEFAIGLALLAAFRPVAGWLNVRESFILAGGAVFVVTGALIWSLTRGPIAERRVRALALANIAGGFAGWLVLVATWPRFEGEGRWLLGFVADSTILLGVAELLLLRRRDSA